MQPEHKKGGVACLLSRRLFYGLFFFQYINLRYSILAESFHYAWRFRNTGWHMWNPSLKSNLISAACNECTILYTMNGYRPEMPNYSLITSHLNLNNLKNPLNCNGNFVIILTNIVKYLTHIFSREAGVVFGILKGFIKRRINREVEG